MIPHRLPERLVRRGAQFGLVVGAAHLGKGGGGEGGGGEDWSDAQNEARDKLNRGGFGIGFDQGLFLF
jgi:hypothetical protein